MFNEATFNEAMFNDASHIMGEDLSKRCLIDDDVLNLLYCKTSSSTEFENERDFFGTIMVAFLKGKILAKFLNSR